MDSSLKKGPSSTPSVGEEIMEDFEVVTMEDSITSAEAAGAGVSTKDEESMDTTAAPTPESLHSTCAIRKSKVKDFSLNASSLTYDVLESDLQTAFKAYFAALKKKESKDLEEFDVLESPNAPKTKEPKSSAFVSALVKESQKTVTENDAPTFSTSDDPRLDFFFGVLEKSKKQRVIELLKDSWTANPLDTLKLLANLRDIREGKGIRVQYQQCLYWLYQNHPKTLYENLDQLVTFGYFKDVLHLLVIILFDGYMHPYFDKDACPKTSKRVHMQPSKCKIHRIRKDKLRKEGKVSRKSRKFSDVTIAKAEASRKSFDDEKRVYNALIAKHYEVTTMVSKIPGNEMTAMRLQYAREKLAKDVKYRIFHATIAQIFASQLIRDVDEMKRKKTGSEDKKEVSLAGKWAPSLEAHFDRYTLIASAIGLEIVKQRGGTHLDILTKTIPVATYLARKLYHKEYCIPLRRYLDVPEHYISAKEYQKVNYKRVAAKCMKKNKEIFIKHDRDRFLEYLLDGKSKVAGASLKPVELIYEAMEMDRLSDNDEGLIKKLILEKQWTSLTESVKTAGGGMLRNAVAVCDVSGSMSGIPMQAAIGLTLLTMSASEEPWNSICITFSESPQIFKLDSSLGLNEKLGKMKAMQWGMNTDLHKVFKLIVSLGKEKQLTDDQMPKILLIFTDMEFDEACKGMGSKKKTNFEAAKDLFQEAGYSVPAIVFWNLRDSCVEGLGTSTPVQKNELGVSLFSGFSGQMLSFIMNLEEPSEELEEQEDDNPEEKGDKKDEAEVVKVTKDKASALSKMTPLSVMLGILSNEKYTNLAIYD